MNPKQQSAFDTIVRGASVFLTGPAGTGKTVTISNVIQWGHDQSKKIGITSSTGISALLIGGRTLHSYLGIGLGTKDPEELAKSVRYKNKNAYDRVRNVDILIIDEISMIDAVLFDKVSKFMAIVRGRPKEPFGGVQIVVSGDFCQLKSVDGDSFCFASKVWKRMRLEVVQLTEIMRQSGDSEFIEMLTELRWGRCSKAILERLESLRATVFEGDIKPTTLYAKNVDVDAMNKREYDVLIGSGAESMTYKARMPSGASKIKTWLASNKIQETLDLCIGAQVVLTYNLDPVAGFVNGSRGVVTELTAAGPRVKFVNEQEIVVEPKKFACEDDQDVFVMAIPLKLAWCITHHRSQGMTIDRLQVALADCFTWGQGYTALSRARSLESIKIINVKASSFQTHPDVIAYYAGLSTAE